MSRVILRTLFADSVPSVDPAQFPSEVFELWSIPSYDRGKPEKVAGSEIGSAKKVVQPQDILLSRIVPHIRRAWVVGPSNGARQIASGEWIVFRSPDVDPKYLRHFLLSDPFHAQFMQTVAGVGGSLLRARPENVGAIEIRLPPLDEQRRIAAILDQADDLRHKRRKALERSHLLTQSCFAELFGDPLTNSKKWPEGLKLGDIAEIASGVTKGRKLNGASTRSIPYLAVANVQDKSLQLETIKYIDATEREIERFRLIKDDLVLTEGGDPDKLGRGTLWNDELPVCIHQNHIFRVRLKSSKFAPIFLNWLVGSELGKRYFLNAAKQTTGIASINMTQLRGFPLIAPPIDLQWVFAARVSEIDKLRAHHHAHLNKLDILFASLQHRAFRGEL